MNDELEARFPLLRAFRYEHLPEHLQAISRPFCELARQVAERCGGSRFSGMETSAALRKLREAKDCAVTAGLA